MAADYRLAPTAEDDLENIYAFTASRWSLDQAERYANALIGMFETLAANPQIARERSVVTPPVRVHPHGSHVIVYRIDDVGVVILRVVHASRDWPSLLGD